ncbi:hypothetical protein [Desulfatiglans anilini]|uniref:hypothetical protein n=1 Tax=Desulfatiglans anilini TaxID=90728 RepID=UPI001294826F|nr:hypothetical protein [Desulfatiglans anilini]
MSKGFVSFSLHGGAGFRRPRGALSTMKAIPVFVTRKMISGQNSVFDPEMTIFCQYQGNRTVARRRSASRRTSKRAD